ncbi:PKD domain-containing protein [bacterium]|nr:PKD domain-containing protein [bacterium]
MADINGPYSGNEGSSLAFDGSASYDPDGTIVKY